MEGLKSLFVISTCWLISSCTQGTLKQGQSLDQELAYLKLKVSEVMKKRPPKIKVAQYKNIFK